jgi:Helicase conserved C-terminal domain
MESIGFRVEPLNYWVAEGIQTKEQMVRDEIVQRLEQDLVGPRSEDEILDSRPTDTYLTGILWPPSHKVSAEEDEDDAKATANDNNEIDLSTPTLGQSKPASIGLSFAIDSSGGRAVSVTFRFASYSPKAFAEGRDAKQTLWQRNPSVISLPIDLNLGVQRIPVAVDTSSHSLEFVSLVRPGPEGSLLCTVSVSNLSKAEGKEREDMEAIAMFQTSLEIRRSQELRFVPRPERTGNSDREIQTSKLLYRGAVEYATGHQASPSIVWSGEYVEMIRTTWLPRQVVPEFSQVGDPEFFGSLVSSGKLGAQELGSGPKSSVLETLQGLAQAYREWIESERLEVTSLPESLKETGAQNLDVCMVALERMEAGIELLYSDDNAFRAFQLSNKAIQRQFEWKAGSSGALLSWRPFQLAFILVTLESVLNPKSEDREVFDLLWFPTGGGKTEAYLAIIGVAAWYQRLNSPDRLFPNMALMRYTLRLLTAQQFARAAALMLACEEQRQSDVFSHDRPVAEFSIGFWVGKDASPNDFRSAKEALSDPFKPSPIQIEKCFVCDRKLSWLPDNAKQAIRPHCDNENCVLGKKFGAWPVMTVDDDIYRSRPTLLIGTVDKFAQVPLNSETKKLFGLGDLDRTTLIIQDELHLISGPLGTMVGLYEGAIDYLLSSDGRPPKIIGSTATIRRAEDQIGAVFNRSSFQFPPPGLDARNSGFAVVDDSKPGRLYVGVTSAGRSPKFAIQAVAGSLMQSASLRDGIDDDTRDGYATLLMYYQSLRELGGALVQVLDDVPDSIGIFAKHRNEVAREISEPQELTSRVSQREIVSMLKALDRKCSEPDSIDAVLATNMVSVGLDISRLGLMLLQGQPKSRSEYIQATSRVGRSSYPGLVVTVLNAAKTRDQSAYESFENWHGAIYRDVEPASATPFAPRAQERALHVALTTMLRYTIPGLLDKPNIGAADVEEILKVKDALLARCEMIAGADSVESQQAEEILSKYLEYWDSKRPGNYKNDTNEADALLQSAEELARKSAVGVAIGYIYPVPNSMRSVEPNSKIRITDRASRFSPNGKSTLRGEPNGQ